MHTIYMHLNLINGKKYIGQTQQPIQQRWKNGAGYKSCSYFYSAILKYGWENFHHLVLEQGEWTQEMANEKEKFYISFYHSNEPEFGYNLTEGGSSTIPKNALPKALEWMKEHPEFGKARAQDMLKWQNEHPEEALAMRKINVQKAVNARKKRVQCIETGEIFESASEAARKTPNTSQSKICMVCRGQRKTSGGFH